MSFLFSVTGTDCTRYWLRVWQLCCSFSLAKVNGCLYCGVWGNWQPSSIGPWERPSSNDWQFHFETTSLSIIVFWHGSLCSVWYHLGQERYFWSCWIRHGFHYDQFHSWASFWIKKAYNNNFLHPHRSSLTFLVKTVTTLFLNLLFANQNPENDY